MGRQFRHLYETAMTPGKTMKGTKTTHPGNHGVGYPMKKKFPIKAVKNRQATMVMVRRNRSCKSATS